MKMMDCVEVMVEKDSYAKEGVHKGLQGVVSVSYTHLTLPTTERV